jgi:hypothetical protein
MKTFGGGGIRLILFAHPRIDVPNSHPSAEIIDEFLVYFLQVMNSSSIDGTAASLRNKYPQTVVYQ